LLHLARAAAEIIENQAWFCVDLSEDAIERRELDLAIDERLLLRTKYYCCKGNCKARFD
jgi:hypothetical protein